MTNQTNPTNPTGHGGFERRDIGVGGVLYFLLGLAVFGLISHFMVTALYHYLEKQTEAQQAPVSALVKNAPADTRHLSVDYRDYLKQNFPSPQLEIDERNQLDKIRLDEEQTLSTYDYIDKNAGTVRIPIARAMDLIAQRGLPVRAQAAETPAATASNMSNKKGPKQ
ncbi:MAG TPA: hypothetical protein VJ999_09255 [Candidatus Sulfotelmatobacter sp.]|nr:hypothetical protein [Candidatus Sulfotelmatobacter sp.]